MKAEKILAWVLALGMTFSTAAGFTAYAEGAQETVVRKDIANIVIPVDEADITITAPIDGQKPDLKASTTAKGVEIAQDPRWYLGNTELDKDSTFSAGKVYFVRVYLKPMEGYILSDDIKVSINGRQAYEPLDGGSIRVFSVSFTAQRNSADSSAAESSSSNSESSSSKINYSSKKPDSSSQGGNTTVSMPGDVNADKKIDIEDAVLVINHVNGVRPLSDNEYSRANVDRNKTVDIEDAVAIISHVNGVKAIG